MGSSEQGYLLKERHTCHNAHMPVNQALAMWLLPNLLPTARAETGRSKAGWCPSKLWLLLTGTLHAWADVWRRWEQQD